MIVIIVIYYIMYIHVENITIYKYIFSLWIWTLQFINIITYKNTL